MPSPVRWTGQCTAWPFNVTQFTDRVTYTDNSIKLFQDGQTRQNSETLPPSPKSYYTIADVCETFFPRRQITVTAGAPRLGSGLGLVFALVLWVALGLAIR